MKITKLEKKKRLYLLELDSDQTCYITEDTIVHFMLTKDKEISPQEFADIQTFAQFPTEKLGALPLILQGPYWKRSQRLFS